MFRKRQGEHLLNTFLTFIKLILFINVNHLEMDNGDIITGCTEFRYLGTIFTKDGSETKNIRHRVTQARKIIGAFNGVWWSKNITRNRKRLSTIAWLKVS
jgi:hypothetical protein